MHTRLQLLVFTDWYFWVGIHNNGTLGWITILYSLVGIPLWTHGLVLHNNGTVGWSYNNGHTGVDHKYWYPGWYHNNVHSGLVSNTGTLWVVFPDWYSSGLY